MQTAINFLILITVGYLGFRAFFYAKLPAPQVLGPMVFVAIISITGLYNFGTFPRIIQTMLTVTVAMSVTQDFVFTGDEGWIQLLEVVALSVIIAFGCAKILMLAGVDAVTALFSSVPGGGSDLGIIAQDLEGADPFRIVTNQTIRFFMMIYLYPVIVKFFVKRELKKANHGALNADEADDRDEKKQELLSRKYKTIPKYANIALVCGIFAVGMLLATLFNKLGISGGTYIGGMLAQIFIGDGFRATMKIRPKMSRKASTSFKIGTMSLLGLSITMDSIKQFLLEWPMIIGLSLVIMFFLIILAWIFYKRGKMDLTTALLATSPGGVVPMSVISDELGGDSLKVALFQLIRIILLVLIAPQIIRFL